MSHSVLLSSVVAAQWNGTSGGTYMWKMIEEDVRSRYLPGHGRLRLIVITDGEDTHSPGEQTHTRFAVKAEAVKVCCAFVTGVYCGIKGMDALMKDGDASHSCTHSYMPWLTKQGSS